MSSKKWPSEAQLPHIPATPVDSASPREVQLDSKAKRESSSKIKTSLTAAAKQQLAKPVRTVSRRACLSCREKKIKCDGVQVCRPCRINNLNCVFVKSHRGGRRDRKNTTAGDKDKKKDKSKEATSTNEISAPTKFLESGNTFDQNPSNRLFLPPINIDAAEPQNATANPTHASSTLNQAHSLYSSSSSTASYRNNNSPTSYTAARTTYPQTGSYASADSGNGVKLLPSISSQQAYAGSVSDSTENSLDRGESFNRINLPPILPLIPAISKPRSPASANAINNRLPSPPSSTSPPTRRASVVLPPLQQHMSSPPPASASANANQALPPIFDKADGNMYYRQQQQHQLQHQHQHHQHHQAMSERHTKAESEQTSAPGPLPYYSAFSNIGTFRSQSYGCEVGKTVIAPNDQHQLVKLPPISSFGAGRPLYPCQVDGYLYRTSSSSPPTSFVPPVLGKIPSPSMTAAKPTKVVSEYENRSAADSKSENVPTSPSGTSSTCSSPNVNGDKKSVNDKKRELESKEDTNLPKRLRLGSPVVEYRNYQTVNNSNSNNNNNNNNNNTRTLPPTSITSGNSSPSESSLLLPSLASTLSTLAKRPAPSVLSSLSIASYNKTF